MCQFNPTRSWTKERSSEYLLNHEQRHFDLTEYHTRVFKRKIREFNFETPKTAVRELKKLFDQQLALHDAMQEDYDEQTNHSINQTNQIIWDAKIDSLLSISVADTPSVLMIPLIVRE